MRYLEGKLNARDVRVGIVVGRFNSLISERLLEGALDCLARHGADQNAVTVCRVPGSFEIPLVARRLAVRPEIDGVICLGAVIRGGTPHFDYVAAEVSKGVASVGLETDKPVIFGVITSDTVEQAIERAGTKAGNRGWDAALSLIEMVDLLTQLG
ncbi:MAG: 6,7-dimethyl-8-ribityllumazine synthase [Spirochaetaceae bacterium]|nr:MAG: 6,7-dimethyl-8-ribityllumazine synthase [Spirochaetaceae bacterium]